MASVNTREGAGSPSTSHSASASDSVLASALLEIRSDRTISEDERAWLLARLSASTISDHSSHGTMSNSPLSSALAARLQAAAAAGTVSAGLNASGFRGMNPHHQAPAGFPFDSAVSAALRAAAGAPQPSTADLPLLNLLGRAHSAPGAYVPSVTPTSQVDTKQPGGGIFSESPEQALVRREKVEEALRSKPQRGRKRENLSELERMELTRTRNREHAKSTRMRKKQRTQELLDAEKELNQMRGVNQLNEHRRQAVVDFFRAWEQTIRSTAIGSDDSAKSDETAVAGNGEATLPNKKLEDIIDPQGFFFVDSGTHSTETSGIARLKDFDEKLVARLTDQYSKTSVEALSLCVKGSTGGVALDCDHTGFVHVDVTTVASSSSSKAKSSPVTTLITAFVRFEFLPETSMIRSVLWTTIHSSFDSAASAADDERLKAQVSHPSVVSLQSNGTASAPKNGKDDTEAVACRKLEEGAPGASEEGNSGSIGMNI